MKLVLYEEIVKDIFQRKWSKRSCIEQLSEKYFDVARNTLVSIYSQMYQRKIKKSFKFHHKKETMLSYHRRYQVAMHDREQKGFICRLSDEINFPPTLIARIILEQHFKEILFNESGSIPKGFVNKYVKDPSLIEDNVLAEEVKLSIHYDDHCGPIIENIKRETGLKYEKYLHDILIEKGIPYYDEEILRNEGYDKTPDFKLVVPIALNNYVINWIESKASFGDEESHSGYLENQFWSYANRFGPGLVIYWFGFITELDVNVERGIMLADEFPKDLIKFETLLDEVEQQFHLSF